MTAYTHLAGGILGKVPHAPEFVRAHGGDSALDAYDVWTTESFEWALGHGGPAFPDAFVNGALHAFGLRAGRQSNTLVAGVLGPSADSAGRRFPLSVVESVLLTDALVARPEVTPLVFENLWAVAGELWTRVRAGDVAELAGTAATLRSNADLAVDEALAMYTEWTARLPLHELWALLAITPSAASEALGLLAAAVEPFRGLERPGTRLSLRVPLGHAGGVALCFWLDALRRTLGWRGTVPSFFWYHGGDRGAALVHLGEPPRATLAELFLPSDKRDEICELVSAGPARDLSALPALAGPVLGVLERPDATVEALLATLEHV